MTRALQRACRAAGRRPPRCGPRRPSGPTSCTPGRESISRASAAAWRGRADRRALRPDLQPAARGPVADVELEADPHRLRRGRGGATRSGRGARRVDHQHRRGVGLLGRQPAELRERERGRRSGSRRTRSSKPRLGQPQRLGQRVGEEPPEAGVARQDALEQRRGSAATCWRPGSACPRARRSMSAPLRHIASRSTSANGASTRRQSRARSRSWSSPCGRAALLAVATARPSSEPTRRCKRRVSEPAMLREVGNCPAPSRHSRVLRPRWPGNGEPKWRERVLAGANHRSACSATPSARARQLTP